MRMIFRFIYFSVSFVVITSKYKKLYRFLFLNLLNPLNIDMSFMYDNYLLVLFFGYIISHI